MKKLYYSCIVLLLTAVAVFKSLGIYTIAGDSMEPTYHAGERVLVERVLWRLGGLSAGDVVVFEDPRGRRWPDLKRVSTTTSEQGTYYLLGDNPAGTDSRQFGAIPTNYILGRVISTL